MSPYPTLSFSYSPAFHTFLFNVSNVPYILNQLLQNAKIIILKLSQHGRFCGKTLHETPLWLIVIED